MGMVVSTIFVVLVEFEVLSRRRLAILSVLNLWQL
jgi:hypothetical protein